MANKQDNLMPIEEVNSRRTREQHSADSRKAGIKSGEARRRKKTMREQAELLLSLANKNPKIEKVMDELGIAKEDQTNQMAMIISMLNVTLKGNKGAVQAFNSLQATIGEKPVEKVEVTNAIDKTIQEVEEYLCKKD